MKDQATLRGKQWRSYILRKYGIYDQYLSTTPEERASWVPMVSMVEEESIDPYSITNGHTGDDTPPEAVYIEESPS